MKSTTFGTLLAGAAIVAAMSAPAAAQTHQRDTYELPAQDLGASLRQVGRTAHVEILFTPSDVTEITAPAIHGAFTLREAIDRLLGATGLSATYTNGAVIIRGRFTQPRADAADEPGATRDIVVTGTRIRGAAIASSVITLTAQNIRNAGLTSLGDVARSIPQSFGGGQNPGVASNVPSTSGSNVGGGSTINLRGLGSDATLTLLNGHRLTYAGARQGIDVSSIPLGAVDRIEIVPDGASALYGSDAVAGVANILLKPDFAGLETSVRYGAATQGAYSEQQYGALGGTRWGQGGLLVAYEYASNTPIVSSDRAFTASRPGVTIYQGQRHHNVLLAGHQALTDTLTFKVDALYNKRWIARSYPQNAAGNLSVSRGEQNQTDESWVIAPSLTLALGAGWRASLSGTYGKDQAASRTGLFAGTTQTASSYVCYCNSARSVELAADGALFSLPAGPVKIAFGTGYRYNALDAFRGAGDVQNIARAQESYYGYGELSVPIVSPDQHIPFVHALSLSGAVRYERYPGIDSVATPKLGLIFAPSADLDLKGSWGKSFRAPTLFQQYQVRSASIYPASILGARGLPATATVILVGGGNAALTPEHATTWSATLDLHPRALPGARLQVSYFSVRYTDRIVTPIAYPAQSLSNPAYARFVTANPSAAAQAAIIASTALYGNFSGGAYIPANVVAIVDSSSVNAGHQTIHGVDFLADYKTTLGGSAGSLALQGDVSYIVSNQQLSAGQPTQQLAGLLYNPPHWRGRGGVTWTHGPLTANTTLSYIGSVDDVQASPIAPVGSMTTLDLTLRYAPATRGIFRNIEVALSVSNMLDATPGRTFSVGFADTTYDSTNYSPIGRFISAGITKKW